tara:strand:- start:356 stop:523 length:168 start_codon:yes stop_codon:yes gene_type:complete
VWSVSSDVFAHESDEENCSQLDAIIPDDKIGVSIYINKRFLFIPFHLIKKIIPIV